MSQMLKQSTAVTIEIGPCVAIADGVTPVTDLTAGSVDEIGVYKHDGTAIVSISGTTTLTHRAGGMYTMTLSTTDTGTLGRLRALIRDDSKILPVWEKFQVVTANAFDTLCSTDSWDVNVTASAITVDANVVSVDAAVVSSGVIDVNVLTIADAPANKIADHNWRRNLSNIEVSDDGDTLDFRSGYGAACVLVNKWFESEGVLYHTQSDDASLIGTKTFTRGTSTLPIIAMDTV